MNPVTERVEPHQPESARRRAYLESFLVSAVTLIIIFIYLIAAYNITGVIVEDSEHFHTAFYWPWLGDLAKEGALFDANTNWNIIPSLA